MAERVLIFGSEGDHVNYKNAVEAAGLTAIVSPRYGDSVGCRALLLPGGGDIFGALPPEEQRVIARFLRLRCPILGICRGMQSLNVFFGGTLYRRIPGHQLPEGDLLHPTRAVFPVSRLLGDAPVVTSNHHQAVCRVGAGLVVCQQTSDGVAEALCHREFPVFGVQYHPERQSFALRRRDGADAAPLFHWLRRMAESSPTD